MPHCMPTSGPVVPRACEERPAPKATGGYPRRGPEARRTGAVGIVGRLRRKTVSAARAKPDARGDLTRWMLVTDATGEGGSRSCCRLRLGAMVEKAQALLARKNLVKPVKRLPVFREREFDEDLTSCLSSGRDLKSAVPSIEFSVLNGPVRGRSVSEG